MWLLWAILFYADLCLCCTNFMASGQSTEDGDVFITYNNDGFGSWPSLRLSPAKDWPNGTMIKGKIPQVVSIVFWHTSYSQKHTYNVVHLTNEYQVTMGETTWENMRDGLKSQTGAIIDYPLLMSIVLQRSKTARELIHWIGVLLDEFGYSSTGETFSIADKNEVWIMDLVGKGDYEQPKLGAVYVARRIPDGYVSGHANQARVQRFPLDDPENCLYHPDTIKFARDRGWYSGPDESFSFSDVYSPVTFESARWCEARVYDMFNKVTVSGTMDRYLDYVKGVNLTNRMPLWVKPESKMNVFSVFDVMRSHYEGTWFDMLGTFDVGNQPFHSGDRYRPMKWKASNGKTYVFERPISIQKTGIAIVSQLRKWLPDGLGPIQWFSFDDTATNVYVPFYAAMSAVPDAYGPHGSFSYQSMFWIQNMCSNWAYYRYDAIAPVIRAKQKELEGNFVRKIEDTDKEGLKIWQEKGKKEAYDYLSKWSIGIAGDGLEEWAQLFGTIFQKFYDGAGENVGYDQQWYDYIAQKTGDHFLYRGNDPL